MKCEVRNKKLTSVTKAFFLKIKYFLSGHPDHDGSRNYRKEITHKIAGFSETKMQTKFKVSY